ncbi:hypothetical protein B5X24_HaOG207296 [Helicoverpa armigera]|uniref:Uncharacterized protein n=1 Tax=Helicoverpa armigera TaxID=29058 RepID=A0A2W1BI21_HELAM|nr:hypothetical protein B5X24_HaOG207296 [Helicoverpa armigera]
MNKLTLDFYTAQCVAFQYSLVNTFVIDPKICISIAIILCFWTRYHVFIYAYITIFENSKKTPTSIRLIPAFIRLELEANLVMKTAQPARGPGARRPAAVACHSSRILHYSTIYKNFSQTTDNPTPLLPHQ